VVPSLFSPRSLNYLQQSQFSLRRDSRIKVLVFLQQSSLHEQGSQQHFLASRASCRSATRLSLLTCHGLSLTTRASSHAVAVAATGAGAETCVVSALRTLTVPSAGVGVPAYVVATETATAMAAKILLIKKSPVVWTPNHSANRLIIVQASRK